jgi:hypothetical protein
MLDRLAQLEAPPVPQRLQHKVHQRLNGRLLLNHVVELGLCGFPTAFGHLSRALGGLIWLSLAGDWIRDDDRTNK